MGSSVATTRPTSSGGYGGRGEVGGFVSNAAASASNDSPFSFHVPGGSGVAGGWDAPPSSAGRKRAYGGPDGPEEGDGEFLSLLFTCLNLTKRLAFIHRILP
jgi:hypothetical protein